MNTAVSTGNITTGSIKPALSRGAVTYAEANGGTLTLSNGNGGANLITLASGESVTLNTPVRFTNGLYATVSAGSAIVHIN